MIQPKLDVIEGKYPNAMHNYKCIATCHQMHALSDEALLIQLGPCKKAGVLFCQSEMAIARANAVAI
jgi:hypothetical protein